MAGITEFDRKLLATGFCTGNVPNGRRKSENPAWEADMGMLDEIPGGQSGHVADSY